MITFKEFNPWAKIQEKFEADPRDIKLWDVLWIPTEAELDKLPSYVNLSYLLDRTIDQWAVPSCTSHAKGHENLIRQAIDYWSTNIQVYPKEFREKVMWHQNITNETGDTLENNLENEYKYWFPWADPKNEATNFKSANYWYVPFKQSGIDIKILKYRISQNLIPYMACYGNKTIRNEMNQWEVKTSITRSQSTWGHAFIAIWVDADYIHFINSWKPNNWDISEFSMSHQVFMEAVKKGMFYWRYRITYDIKDFIEWTPLFPDYTANEDTEEYQAVKRAKDKWLIQWVTHSDWKRYLEPYRPLTRLEMLLILYRQKHL